MSIGVLKRNELQNISLLRKILIGWVLGLGIVATNQVILAAVLISDQSLQLLHMISPDDLSQFIWIIGIILSAILASAFSALDGVSLRKAILIGVLSPLISYALLVFINLLLATIAGPVILAKLGLSFFLFALNIVVIVKILSRGLTFFRKALIPIVGYCISLIVALLIQQAIPDANWIFKRFLQVPVAWMNVAFFFDWRVRQYPIWNISGLLQNETVRPAMTIIFVINSIVILLAVFFPPLELLS